VKRHSITHGASWACQFCRCECVLETHETCSYAWPHMHGNVPCTLGTLARHTEHSEILLTKVLDLTYNIWHC
jgi:hypothetical protein